MLRLVWLIPIFPLAGFLINFLLGRKLRLGERVVSIVGCGVILASLLLTLGAFYDYHWNYNPGNETKPYISNHFTWLPGGKAHQTLKPATEAASGDCICRRPRCSTSISTGATR